MSVTEVYHIAIGFSIICDTTPKFMMKVSFLMMNDTKIILSCHHDDKRRKNAVFIFYMFNLMSEFHN
jgi:hypothetical protein